MFASDCVVSIFIISSSEVSPVVDSSGGDVIFLVPRTHNTPSTLCELHLTWQPPLKIVFYLIVYRISLNNSFSIKLYFMFYLEHSVW